MKKRVFIRIISFMAALIAVVTVFSVKYYKRSKKFGNEIKYTYSRSLEEVYSSVNKISVALQKFRYATSANQSAQLATEIYTEAKIAKQAFSQLPTGEKTIENINKFFSQVGNYSIFLSQNFLKNGEITEAEEMNIISLSEIAENISTGFSNMQINLNRTDYWQKIIDDALENALSNNVVSDTLSEFDDFFTDYPSLLYDGPYSDHISSYGSYLIENSEFIDEAAAKSIAASALKISEDELFLDNYGSGKIPSFNFAYGEGTATVSINGGYLINFRKYNAGETFLIDYRQAKKYAEKFISEIFDETFIANYYFCDNGICVVNFAATENGIIYYPDIVKVGVDMSNGDIAFFDARGYISNFKPRELNLPKLTSEEAEKSLPDSLTVISTAVALIPTDGESEILCYEFLCKTTDGKEILLYLNAENGEQEDIFLVLKTDGGTLLK